MRKDEEKMISHIIAAICAAAALISLSAAVFLYFKSRRLIDSLDAMLESTINDTFSEEHFSEQKLSRLESKMYRYLTAGRTSRRQITEEKNAVKTLVSDISHQTKTPIANILLYTQLLGETPDLNDHAKHLTTQIENQAKKLHFLIAALIKTSRLENGIIQLSPKENSLIKLLNALDFTAAADQKKIRFSVQHPKHSSDAASQTKTADNLTAVFDFKWTLEAISNIIDNGIKYTPAGGSVTISLQDYEFFVRIDISDTGIGMTEEETSRIFTRFYRSPRTADEPGVGIGLYLCREIISKEGGYLKVTSEIEKGSVFSVFLPKQSGNLSKL